jgi:hypothetical protein
MTIANAIKSQLAATGRTRKWLAGEIGTHPANVTRMLRTGRMYTATAERALAVLDLEITPRPDAADS